MARRRRVDRHLREQRERKYRLRSRTTKFIPASDSDFAKMARTFANHIARNTEGFKISQEQSAELLSAVEKFREALTRTLLNDSAGPKATSLKNDARRELEKVIRATGRIVRACESLDDFDRLELNLSARPERLNPRKCPQIAPVLKFVGATHGMNHGAAPRHILEYRNDFDLGDKARPHGATRLELFVELVPVGAPVPAHPGQLSGGRLWYMRSYSTSRFETEFPVMSDGTPMLVVYWGRWADSRGGFGPFSQTCVARVEGGQLPELQYVGGTRPQIAQVSRRVEHREFALLPAESAERVLEANILPALEHVQKRAELPLINAA